MYFYYSLHIIHSSCWNPYENDVVHFAWIKTRPFHECTNLFMRDWSNCAMSLCRQGNSFSFSYEKSTEIIQIGRRKSRSFCTVRSLYNLLYEKLSDRLMYKIIFINWMHAFFQHFFLSFPSSFFRILSWKILDVATVFVSLVPSQTNLIRLVEKYMQFCVLQLHHDSILIYLYYSSAAHQMYVCIWTFNLILNYNGIHVFSLYKHS